MCPVCHLNLHEYQSKKLMESYKINTQKFEIAETPEEASRAAKNLGKFFFFFQFCTLNIIMSACMTSEGWGALVKVNLRLRESVFIAYSEFL